MKLKRWFYFKLSAPYLQVLQSAFKCKKSSSKPLTFNIVFLQTFVICRNQNLQN